MGQDLDIIDLLAYEEGLGLEKENIWRIIESVNNVDILKELIAHGGFDLDGYGNTELKTSKHGEIN